MEAARPYHHGNLRQALLDRAAVVLRERGVPALSLRELARDLGVSHAAPGRHFPDRQALLDAVAAEGFARLGARIRSAVAAEPDFAARVRSLAGVYVGFATTEANLLELLFSRKQGECAEANGPSARDAFAPTVEVFRRGQAEGALPPGDPAQAALLFLATLQGIAAMVNGGVIPQAQLEEMIDGAVSRLLLAPTR